MGKSPSTELTRRLLMQSAAAMGAIGAAGSLFSSSAQAKEKEMLLATTKVEDFDRFLRIFSTTSLEKRKQHGCKGAIVFRDPNETDRVWVVFDWDEKGWQSFASDPEVPPIMKEAGHTSKPQVAKIGGQYGA
jgi:quinol monooxygenase YgiN